jgi:DNA invertase Pin-like site-specific DNA recombinase
MGGRPRLSPETIAQIEDLIKQGVRAPEIARRVGIARSTVTGIEKKMGVVRTSRPTELNSPAHPWARYGEKLRFDPAKERKIVP